MFLSQPSKRSLSQSRLRLGACLFALLALSATLTWAQPTYPDKTVRMVVPMLMPVVPQLSFVEQEEKEQAKRLVVYSCTSGYPVPFEDICLMEIPRISGAYKAKVSDIGFSGHHLGIAVDIAAYTLGATWVERHFTKDRTWKGTDHAASLEFAGLQKLARDLNAVYRSLRSKSTEILAIEQVQRDKLKYRG